jgi:hypothetical protein
METPSRSQKTATVKPPRKEFGFTVVVRVVEELEAEIAPRK